jgi:hypothetical protein
MHRAVFLAALASFVPLAAHADPSGLPPSAPTAPPAPVYRPPPMAKVSSVDDIAGDWTVTTTIRFTSCKALAPAPAPSSRTEELWTVDHNAGAITIRTDSAQEYTGTAAAARFGSYRHQLGGKPRATEEVMQLNQFLKDRFYGTLLRAQTVPRKGLREVCVTQIDISGKRATP